MFFEKFLKKSIAGILLFFSLSCSEKIETGILLREFTGIDKVEVLSTTAVHISWNLHERYKEYKVYYNLSSEPLLTTSFSEGIIRNLTPNTNYTFKVVGSNGSETAGGGKELTVKTYASFQGIDALVKDSDGNIVVSWKYDEKVSEYQIFYKKYEDPTSVNTSSWLRPDGVSSDKSYIASSLEGATRYHFIVHVKYLDGTIDRTTKVLSITTAASFPTPTYILSPISIGSLPSAKITPVVNSQYLNANYTSRMYLNNSPISDPLIGAGTLTFSSNLNFPLGQLSGLELRVNYNNGTLNETKIFDKLSTYIKGLQTIEEKPPVLTLSSGLSAMGEALATGDFNCDGAPDLAVGLPRISIATLGVKEPQAGAVYIYYSKKEDDDRYRLQTTPEPLLNPANPGVDPQILTFEDLTYNALFGKSLSGNGNLNGDSYLGKACQDLIVGAPQLNIYGNSYYDGGAFVFFGSNKGLKSPNRWKDVQQNTETCNGLSDGATCSAVMLWPNMKLYPAALYRSSSLNGEANIEFGYSVSFVGDFNADGYDDLAVGAPNSPWDGVVPNPTYSNRTGGSQYEYGVGMVSLYFGSKYGLGKETIGAHKLRFLKIFPPYPHANMRFGHSLAGGVDVDGSFPVKLSASSAYYGGSDLVIGAPGFNYPYWNSASKFYAPAMSGCWASGAKSPDTCSVASGFHGNEDGSWGAYNTGTSSYGFLMNSGSGVGSAVGAAFVYFGVGATSPGQIFSLDMDRNGFYQCGRRGASSDPTQGLDHFSCFGSAQTGTFGSKMPHRILYPRSDYTTAKNKGFGTSVAMAGIPKRYNYLGSLQAYVNDPNTDGFGEVIVGSSYFSDTTTSQSNAGALWVFYGNNYRLYEHKSFFGLDTGGASRSDADWVNGNSNCSAFSSNANGTKKLCAPTLIRPTSLASNTYLGLYPEAMTVGDITGDGVLDVIVGGTGDPVKGSNSGSVFAFTSLGGMGVTSNFFNYYNSAGKPSDYFGRSVALGDFDGDILNGKIFNDLAVGAYLDKSTKYSGGGVFGFLSKGQPLSSMITLPDFNLQDTAAALQSFGLGASKIVGDINGDGFEDAVTKISRPSANSIGFVTDAVIYYGSKIGLVTTQFCLLNKSRIFKSAASADTQCYPSVNPTQGITLDSIPLPQMILRSNALSEGWAESATSAGDVNGDGFSDVAFLDYRSGGQLVVYFGSRGGLQAVNNPNWVPAYGDPQLVTKAQSVMPGYASYDEEFVDDLDPWERDNLIFGDFNGDFKTDLVLLNPTGSSFFKMNKAGSGTSGVLPKNGADPVVVDGGWQCGTFAPGETPPASCAAGSEAENMGRVFVYYGSDSGLQTPKLRGYAGVGNEPSVNFGNPGSHAAYLVDAYGSETLSSLEACNVSTGTCKVQYLYSPMVENVMSGYERMSHLFGQSATAGDFDGDGIDDLIISAPGWEDLDCYYDNSLPTDPAVNKSRFNYGKIFKFKGSNKGIQAGARDSYYNSDFNNGSCKQNSVGRDEDPSLNLTGSGVLRTLMPPILGDTLPGRNATSRRFGYHLSSADFNKDGVKDLIVGNPLETPIGGYASQGVMYVFYGPLCGADNSSSVWDYYSGLSNYNKQKYFNDPYISAVVTPDCNAKKLAPQAFILKDGADSDYYGSTVLSGQRNLYLNDPVDIAKPRADFNGDGYDDALIGGLGWDDNINGNANHGRGVVFFGSTYGLFTDDFPNSSVVLGQTPDADGTNHATVKPFWVNYTETELSPGYYRNHTSAGDVNGDGTMDFMVTTENHDGFAPLKGINIGNYFLLY